MSTNAEDIASLVGWERAKVFLAGRRFTLEVPVNVYGEHPAKVLVDQLGKAKPDPDFEIGIRAGRAQLSTQHGSSQPALVAITSEYLLEQDPRRFRDWIESGARFAETVAEEEKVGERERVAAFLQAIRRF
jgi:hypothetical protein